jgi:hypothetical protein
MHGRRILGSLWFPVTGGAQPGDWLRAALACSTLAPIAFFIATAWHSLGKPRIPEAKAAILDQRSSLPFGAIVFGSMLAGLALINHILRRDPWTIDVTLRQGNGGFIVVGAMLALLGTIGSRR